MTEELTRLTVEGMLQDRLTEWPTRTRWEGLDALRASWPGALFEASLPVVMEVHRLVFTGVQVESISTTEHRCVRSSALIAEQPTNVVALDFLTDGVMVRQEQGVLYEQVAGQACLTVLDEPFAYSWSTPGHMFRVLVAARTLQEQLGSGVLPTGPQATSALIPAMVSFLQAVLETPRSAQEDRLLERTTLGLAASVVMQTASSATPAWRLSGQSLGAVIEQYVETHLSDLDLSPTTIAAALGICLRHVHGAFNTSDRTLAAYIRERRIAVVADVLRTTGYPARMTDLAMQAGFRNADLLRRTFRNAYGMTPRAFNELVHNQKGNERSGAIGRFNAA